MAPGKIVALANNHGVVVEGAPGNFIDQNVISANQIGIRILGATARDLILESGYGIREGGYLSLWAVYHLFRLLTGKEGMGYGDFKLLALFGAWLGWTAVPVIVLLSSFVGAVVGIALIGLRGAGKSSLGQKYD